MFFLKDEKLFDTPVRVISAFVPRYERDISICSIKVRGSLTIR